MNIFQKTTLKNLKENRTRTLVTIIGIILSAAMFTATTISISSMQHYLIQSSLYNRGDWYGTASGLTAGEVGQLNQDSNVEQAVSMEFLGYSPLESCLNTDKPYLCVYGIQTDFTEMMPIHLIEGRMPENSQEILLPSHLESNGGISYALGSQLGLELGNRISQDGETLPYSMSYTGSKDDPYMQADNGTAIWESFLPKEERDYTVVGFYERPDYEDFSAPGYTALTIGENSAEHPYTVYIRTDTGKNTAPVIESIFSKLRGFPLQAEMIPAPDGASDAGSITWNLNYELLRYYGYSGESRYNDVMYSLAVILIGIIMFGSISLIYNAFSISVSERTKQFGLLASIGATKRQLTGSVLFEALFLGCIGIPLGILSGLTGIGITLYLVKDMVGNILGIVSTTYEGQRLLSMGPAEEVSLAMHPSFGALAAAILISLATILISAYIPVRRAMRRPAIDAIRQTGDIAIRPGRVKTSWLTQKLFGFEGTLATKNYKRSRKKYRATVISLFLSIVLFISTSSWCAYLTSSAKSVISDSGYDIIYRLSPTDQVPSQSLYDDLASAPGIAASAYETSLYLQASIPTSALTQEYLDYKKYLASQIGDAYQEYDTSLLPITLHFLEDAAYRTFLKEQNLPESTFYNAGAPAAVAVDTLWLYNEYDRKYHSLTALANAAEGSPTAYLTRERDGYYLDESSIDGASGKPYYTLFNPETDDRVTLPIEEACLPIPLSIGAVTKNAPAFFTESHDTIQLFYPFSFLEKVLAGLEPGIAYSEIEADGAAAGIAPIYMLFQCTDNQKAEAAMAKKLSDWNQSSDSLYNYAASIEGERAMMTVINVFAFGFISLISLIAAANVFNTISTNVGLRQREFAMLKSIGMTPKGFRKMMNFECLLYGVKGLLYGLPVSFAVTWLIYRSISNGVEGAFYIPWHSIAIAVGSVFLVVFATMVYSMKKIGKKNTVDALRNENL